MGWYIFMIYLYYITSYYIILYYTISYYICSREAVQRRRPLGQAGHEQGLHQSVGRKERVFQEVGTSYAKSKIWQNPLFPGNGKIILRGQNAGCRGRTAGLWPEHSTPHRRTDVQGSAGPGSSLFLPADPSFEFCPSLTSAWLHPVTLISA